MDWDMTKKSLEATLTDTMEKLITGKQPLIYPTSPVGHSYTKPDSNPACLPWILVNFDRAV